MEQNAFNITFEMRTSEYVEICISIDNQTNRQEGFYVKRKEGERKQVSGETERERACVCVCIDRNQRQRQSASTTASVEKHICGNN